MRAALILSADCKPALAVHHNYLFVTFGVLALNYHDLVYRHTMTWYVCLPRLGMQAYHAAAQLLSRGNLNNLYPTKMNLPA